MENINPSSIKNYLSGKNIKFAERGKEIIIRCVYDNCDQDSKGNEAHLYINADTGANHCFKCGFNGNMVTICKIFDDDPKKIFGTTPNATKSYTSSKSKLDNIVERCCRNIPERIRQYLNARGITDDIIQSQNIGYGDFYENPWITFPVKDEKGKFSFIKLKRDPDDKSNPDKGKCYPFGIGAELYEWETLKSAKDFIVICEGEPDCLLLLANNIPAVTSTNGASTFKEEWVQAFGHLKKVYVCYDNDTPGQKGAERVLQMFSKNERLGVKTYKVTLPEDVEDHGDITDWVIKLKRPIADLFEKYSAEYPERVKIDTSKFQPMTADELVDILGLTIKKDEANKLLTFLGELSAFTEYSQLNISYNAPSSTGKSYIPVEIAQLFPIEDLVIVGYCSPTSFFHSQAKYDPTTDEHLVDLSRKILIFLDQPHVQLLEHLRPLLSHDQKEIKIKITDKNSKGGNRTKNILLRGFPAVVFCTAGLTIDEQEATRFLLLSPQTSSEKIRDGIYMAVKKEADLEAYKFWLEEDTRRSLLKERIEAIKQAQIMDIKLVDPTKLQELFLQRHPILKPRHQRDIKKIIFVIKTLALLNLWWREQEGSTITASENDVNEAFKVWDSISESQELGLPPYIYSFYKEILLPLWEKTNGSRNIAIKDATGAIGLTRKGIMKQYRLVYGRMMADWMLRQQILPMLDNAGLISQEPDPNGDKRTKLVFLVGEDNSSNTEDEVIQEISIEELIQQAEIVPNQDPQTLL